MTIAELLRIVPFLAAPAFFALLGLAALGAPFLASICLIAAESRRTQLPSAYARRVLRMGATMAAVSLAVVAALVCTALVRTPWLQDWLRAGPVLPSVLAVLMVIFVISSILHRAATPPRHQLSQTPIIKTVLLAVLALVVLWLALTIMHDLAMQALEIVSAPRDGAVAVVPLLLPNLTLPSSHFLTGLAATQILAITCASALSQQYLLLRRDYEPFGQDAFSQLLLLASRCALRSGLLVAAAYPMTWSTLTNLLGDLPEAGVIRLLLSVSVGALLLACLFWALISRSARPSKRSGLIHGAGLLLWLCLTCLLSAALVYTYAR
jgi:hypothetical protein